MLSILHIDNFTLDHPPDLYFYLSDINVGFYAPFLVLWHGIVGPFLQEIYIDCLLNMELPPDILDTFLAAKNLETLFISESTASLVHRRTLITLESIVEFAEALPVLKSLLVPWSTVDSGDGSIDDSSIGASQASSGTRSSHSSNVRGLNICTLGYPCFHLHQNAFGTSVLDIIQSTFPSLSQLIIFSCYITSWKSVVADFQRSFPFACYKVTYSVDVSSDL